MIYFHDKEKNIRWFDRIDNGKADPLTEPCEMCEAIMNVKEEEGDNWIEFDLCPDCEKQLDVNAVILEQFGVKPYVHAPDFVEEVEPYELDPPGPDWPGPDLIITSGD